MSASRTSLLVLVAFVAGTLLAWQATGERVAPAADAGAALPAERTRRAANRMLPPSVQKLLAPVRAARTDDERMRATLALAAAIPVDQLEQWYAAGWFGMRESMESLVFERVTQDRWLQEDPEVLFAYLVRTEHPETNEMAGRWAKYDPKGAFAFLRSSSQPDELEDAAWAMKESLAEKIPQVLAEEMPWILETVDISYASSLIRRMVELQPELVSGKAGEWPEPLRQAATVVLDQEALVKDFPSALSALANEPDGKARFISAVDGDGRSSLIEDVLDHGSSLPPGWFAGAVVGKSHYLSMNDPARWLEMDLGAMGVPENEVRQIRERALYELASDQPEEALKLLGQGTLPEAERLDVVRWCFDEFSEQDPRRAEELLGQLSNPDEIALARNQIEEAGAEAKRVQVRSLPEWIASFSSDTYHADEYAAALWDARQAMEATAAFEALPPDGKGEIALNLLGEALDEIPPELAAAAYGELLSHPPSGDDVTPEDVATGISDLANDWGLRDPLAASRWVGTLPEGFARLWAAKNLAARWAEYEPAAARRWVSSLPVGERSEVAGYLDSGAAWKEQPEEEEE